MGESGGVQGIRPGIVERGLRIEIERLTSEDSDFGRSPTGTGVLPRGWGVLPGVPAGVSPGGRGQAGEREVA